MTQRTVPVSIVGAGIAGLYAAWRLVESGFSGTGITIYEASNRVGGRIFTAAPPDCMPLDLGARNIRIDHPLTAGLITRLGLSRDPSPAGGRRDLAFLRGRWKSEAEIRRSYLRRAFDYDVAWNVQRRNPRRLLRRVLASNSGGGKWTGADALLPAIDGVPLDRLVRSALRGEEFDYLCDRLGYSFFDFPLDARSTLAWFEENFFGSRSVALAGGASSLTQTLKARLVEKGCRIETEHRLVAMDVEDNVMRFERSDRSIRDVSWTRVILALPVGRIASVKGLGERDEIRALFKAVEPWPISTGAVWYRHAWWKTCGFEAARIRTDLPLGTLWHHAPSAPAPADPQEPELRGGAAINFYAEGAKSRVWEDATTDTPAGTWLGPDHPFTRRLHTSIADLHRQQSGARAPEPVGAILQPWPASESGTAFHLWRHGHDSTQIVGASVQPFSGVDLHICGESLSNHQGWIEGALETSEAVLTHYFGLAPFLSERPAS